MTDLHTQYQTLLRRGMPEHLRLSWRYGIQWVLKRHVSHQHGHVEAEEDARDLVTMHAVRWLLGTLKDAEIGWETCWAFEKARIADNTRLNAQGCPAEYKAADHSILDAILAATEHLEPK